MIKLSDLRVRDVVNIADGRRLGTLCDVEVDLQDGRITALVIAGASRVFGLLGHEPDFVIPWGDIVKIGADVILVNLSTLLEGGGPPAGLRPPRGEA
jgi:YlmC/YmxH family sporulation protein